MSNAHGMTYGKLLTFIAYMGMIYTPLNFFSDMMSQTADCSNALQRLFEIMDAQPEVREAEHPVELDGGIGKIEFDDVCFSYQKGRRIIDHVSFSLEEGKILGIVGHTGAGKSTIANLLMRLYDTDSGEIRIDGKPVRELSFRSLYQNIAIVSQETYLFMGTILDNKVCAVAAVKQIRVIFAGDHHAELFIQVARKELEFEGAFGRRAPARIHCPRGAQKPEDFDFG